MTDDESISTNIKHEIRDFMKERFPEGVQVHFDYHNFHLCGIKSLHIKIQDKEFVFTTQEIMGILTDLKAMYGK